MSETIFSGVVVKGGTTHKEVSDNSGVVGCLVLPIRVCDAVTVILVYVVRKITCGTNCRCTTKPRSYCVTRAHYGRCGERLLRRVGEGTADERLSKLCLLVSMGGT